MFLSTPSARRATGRPHRRSTVKSVSIHALREEGDGVQWWKDMIGTWFLSTPSARRATRGRTTRPQSQCCFYPRPPRGGRPRSALRLRLNCPCFYPRPPRGGRPPQALPLLLNRCVSIHALREEGDQHGQRREVQLDGDFYPRPPRGGRLWKHFKQFMGEVISIHALREEGDSSCLPYPQRGPISIHALREEGDIAIWYLFSTS